jgi:hypothetical protein
MRKLIILLLLSTSILSLCAQETYLFQPTELTSVIAFEDSIKSDIKGFYNFNPYFDENIEDIYEYWPKLLNKAFIVKRFIDDFSPSQHAYYFIDKDSIVKLVYYKWGFANPTLEVSNEQIRKQTYFSKKAVWDFVDKRVIIEMTADKIVTETEHELAKEEIVIPRSKIQVTILMIE